MLRWVRWALGVAVAAAVVAVPFVHYRASYAHAKRLRVVTPGKLYRSGQLTANGIRDAQLRFDLGYVVNLQEEARDPLIPMSWQGKPSVRESDLCKSLNVTYVPLDGGVLDHPGQDPGSRPLVIDEFFEVMDRAHAENRPVLIHCLAGLHRTGLMVAVYRMEYEGWTAAEAIRELRANGFGTFAATDGNDYVAAYILNFQKGQRRSNKLAGPARPVVGGVRP